MGDPAAMIGERLRELRASRSISLEEAARLTGVSKPMLGQIERGQSAPTVTTLWKIATGMKIPLSSLLQERRSEYSVIDVRGAPPIAEDEGRMRAYPIFAYDPMRSMEVFFLELDAGCYHASEKHAEGVEEYLLVLSGTLRLGIDGKELAVRENEAIRFLADVPHEYRNPAQEPCAAYNIIFYPR